MAGQAVIKPVAGGRAGGGLMRRSGDQMRRACNLRGSEWFHGGMSGRPHLVHVSTLR